MANKHMYRGRTLLMHACIEGELRGPAGGTSFLVRNELLEQELFLDFGSINIVGFYGPEAVSTLWVPSIGPIATTISR